MDSQAQAPKIKVRDANIELGRICCFISIAGIHLLPRGLYDFNAVSKAAVIAHIYCKMFATPFFFLIMGAFMSSGTPYRKSLTRVIKKIAIPFIFTFFLMIQCVPLINQEMGMFGTLTRLHVDLSDYFYSLATVSFESYSHMYHLWFIRGMFMCYLLMPIFRVFLYDSPIDKRYKIYIVILGIIVFIIPQTLQAISTNAHIQQIGLALPTFPFFWIWLLLLGSYINGWMQQNRDAVALYIMWLAPIALFVFGMANFYLTKTYDLKPDLTVDRFAFTDSRGNITVFLPNLLPFLWFHCVRITDVCLSKIILYISDKCFYMYLVHVPLIALFHRYINIDNPRAFIGHFLHWLLIVFLSFAIACILKYFERKIYSYAAKLWQKVRLFATL